MAGLVSELVLLMKEQAEYFENLLALSFEKKGVIIENNIDELQKITSIENIIISKNLKLEKKRDTLLQDIAMVLNKNVQELTISALLAVIENQPEFDELKEVSERTINVVEKLKNINEQNKALTYNALDYIDFSMNVFQSSITQEPPTYSNKKDGFSGENAFFDAKQ